MMNFNEAKKYIQSVKKWNGGTEEQQKAEYHEWWDAHEKENIQIGLPRNPDVFYSQNKLPIEEIDYREACIYAASFLKLDGRLHINLESYDNEYWYRIWKELKIIAIEQYDINNE